MTKKIVASLCSIALLATFGILLLTYTQISDSQIHDLPTPQNEADAQSVENGWSFYTDENGEVTPLIPEEFGQYSGLEYNGQTFYYSRVLPEAAGYFPLLALQSGDAGICVFLDQELIYTNCPQHAAPVGQLRLPMIESDSIYHDILISLPSDCGGKNLTVAQASSPYTEIEGRINMAIPYNVTLYDAAGYERSLIANAAESFYPAVALYLLALLLIGAFLYQAFFQRLDIGLLPVILALFLSMTYVLNGAFLSQYFSKLFPDYFNEFCLELIFIMILLFFLFRMQLSFKKILLLFLILDCAALTLKFVLLRTDLISYGDLYLFLILLPDQIFVAASAVTVGLSILETKNGSRFFRVFLTTASAIVFAYLIYCVYTLLTQGPSYILSVASRLAFAFSTGHMNFPLLLCRTLLFLSVLVCSLWNAAAFLTQIHTDVRILSLKYKMVQDSYQYIQNQHEQIMMMRHDLKKHLVILGSLLKEKNYQQADAYLGELMEANTDISSVFHLEHHVLNIVLNSKATEATSRGIRLDVRRGECPSDLLISNKDLSALLMNILDNAIEGALKSGAAPPSIVLDFYIKDNYFCFTCENSISKPVHVEEECPTEGGALPEHGYGLRIIRQIVSKYNGILKFESTPSFFALHFFLPLQLYAKKNEPRTDS